MSQKLVPWEGSWPSSLAWILLIGQTALFAWSQDIHRHWLQYYLSSYWHNCNIILAQYWLPYYLTVQLTHASPQSWSLCVSASLGPALHSVSAPGSDVLITQVTVHYRVVTEIRSHMSALYVTIIIIPGVPTHPGDKLSAPAPTGHAALRGRSMCPAKPRI